jgi:ankyrin repeat protein
MRILVLLIWCCYAKEKDIFCGAIQFIPRVVYDEMNDSLWRSVISGDNAEIKKLLSGGWSYELNDIFCSTYKNGYILSKSGCRNQDINLGRYVNVVNIYGKSLLTIAAELGDIDIINLLLDAGAEYMTDKRDTALHVAAQTNRDDIAKLLIDRLGCVDKPGEYNVTPLYNAARYQSFQVAKILLEHRANIHALTPFGINILSHGVATFELTELLIKYGANINGVEGFAKNTPLMTAARRSAPLSVFQLLIEKGARIDLVNTLGETAEDIYKGDNKQIKNLIRLIPGQKRVKFICTGSNHGDDIAAIKSGSYIESTDSSNIRQICIPEDTIS